MKNLSASQSLAKAAAIASVVVALGLHGVLGPRQNDLLSFLFVLPVALVAAAYGLVPAIVVAGLGLIVDWIRNEPELLESTLYGATALAVAVASFRRGAPWSGGPRASDYSPVALNNVEDALIATDARGRIEYMNPAAEKLSGWTSAAAIGASTEDVVRLVDSVSGRARPNGVAAVLERSATVRHESQALLIHKDGERSPVDVMVFPIPAPNVAIDGAVMIIRDVTEELQARGRGQLLSALVESSSDAIATKDLNGIVTSWNASAERLFGYTAAEMIGKPIATLIPPGHDDEEPSILERIRRDEPVEHYETIRRRKDGTLIPISLTVSPVHDAEGNVIGASKIARDITERRKLQQQVRDRIAELAEFNRRKDEFLATLAHELRNPLAPIASAVEIMRLAGDDRDLIENSRLVIQRQQQQLKRLVDDLLDVARITRGRIDLRKEWVSLRRVLENAVEAVSPSIARCGHDLRVSLPEESLRVHVDPVRLSQVVTNLLDNAAKYTPAGGVVRLTAIREEDQIVIRVEDNGMGISAASLRTLFDAFGPGQSQGEGGLGIGLLLIKAIVQMHGGTVQARSDGIGLGSQFEVRLPIGRPDTVPAPNSEDLQTKHESRRILVVEDNRDVAETLATLLRLIGHEVSIAHDGATALARAPQFLPQVVLLDLGLPDMSGYEVARQLRADDRVNSAVLVAVTGWGQEEHRQRARDAGFDHHLTKPTTMEDLLAVLDSAVSKPHLA